MNANQLFIDTRAVHVRELKGEITRLNDELAHTRAELDSLRSHFALALAAARDADNLPAGGHLVIVDGWNALLCSVNVLDTTERRKTPAEKRMRLRELARVWLDTHPADFIWIVFDGTTADGSAENRLRTTFTGGTGQHRADRLVCDYLRMRRLTGTSHEVIVLTEDKDFRRTAEALGATVRAVTYLTDRSTQ